MWIFWKSFQLEAALFNSICMFASLVSRNAEIVSGELKLSMMRWLHGSQLFVETIGCPDFLRFIDHDVSDII